MAVKTLAKNKASKSKTIDPKKECPVRENQIRVLKTLLKHPKGLYLGELCKEAGVAQTGNVGPDDPKNFTEWEKKYGKKPLTGLGFVKVVKVPANLTKDEEPTSYRNLYLLTDSGKEIAKSFK